MKSVFKKTVCVALTAVVIVLALAGLAACGKNSLKEFELPQGSKPGLENRITADQLGLIEAGMAQGASQDEVKQAVIALYDVANSSRIEDNRSLMVQESIMGIRSNVSASSKLPIEGDEDYDKNVGRFLGFVKMHGYTLKNGGSWYNEFAAEASSSNAVLGEIVGAFSTMVKVNYHFESDPDVYYFNIIKDSACEADCDLVRFPYNTYKLLQSPTKYDLEGFKDAANVLDAPNELYNMDFVKDIIADGATIEHNDGVYKVHFEVDPNADSELLEQWYRLPQKDMQEGGQTIEAYLRYVCDLEVWDNGYVKSYVADYVRDAGMGSGITLDKFNYLWNEDEIIDIIKDDVRLDDTPFLERPETFDEYIAFYTKTEVVKGTLQPLFIVLIVIACVVFAAIVAVIVVEVLVRKGKLPKLAAKRQARKQKRLAKKAAKSGGATENDTQEGEARCDELDAAPLNIELNAEQLSLDGDEKADAPAEKSEKDSVEKESESEEEQPRD